MAEPARKTLVLGGARSGKSRFAQSLAAQHGGPVTFLATATAGDDEMQAKIDRHRLDRAEAGLSEWTMVEEPLALAPVVNGMHGGLLLIDCLTFYAANLLALEEPDRGRNVAEFLEALHGTSSAIILVSNEVGSGVVPEYVSGRQFRDLLGELNQKTAAIASDVLLMVAGLPLRVKGQAGEF